MKLIYEKLVDGENKLFYSNENIPTQNDIELIPEQIEKINQVILELDLLLDPEVDGSLAKSVNDLLNDLDPTIENSLASTVNNISESLTPMQEDITDIQTEIGTDETADTILGRITALESSGITYTTGNVTLSDYVTGVNVQNLTLPDYVTFLDAYSMYRFIISFIIDKSSITKAADGHYHVCKVNGGAPVGHTGYVYFNLTGDNPIQTSVPCWINNDRFICFDYEDFSQMDFTGSYCTVKIV